jgi:hypothetical protein
MVVPWTPESCVPNCRSSFKPERSHNAFMDPLFVVFGLLFLTWPLVFRGQLRRVRRKALRKGGDVEPLDRVLDRRWIRAALWAVQVAGLLLVILGLVSS